ncbi:MAG: TonB-dependent receptor [Myxococcota bacterium]
MLRKHPWLLTMSCVALTLLVGSVARAQETISFTPETLSPQQGQPLEVRGTFQPGGQVARARVRFRVQGQKEYSPVDMVKDDDANGADVWIARIEGENVQPPALEIFVVVQTTAGKALVVHGSAKAPVVLPVAGSGAAPVTTAPAEENPLETAEERELRTGERAGGGTLGGGALRRTRPQPTDLRVDEAADLAAGKLQEEFRVFAAEDATAIASTYAQRTRTAPGIITVINRSRIEQMGARTLLDVLKIVPGFETSKTILGFDEVSIRGIRSDPEILLLVDGHRVANIYDGRNPWDIPADIIERVEIIRGPGSALYGTGAFLGVVNVVTREHEHVRVRTGVSLLKPSQYTLAGKAQMTPTVVSPDPHDPANDAGAAGLFAPEGSAAGGINAFGAKGYASGYAKVTRGQRTAVTKDGFSETGLERPANTMLTDAREASTALTAKVDVAPPFLKGGHGFGRTFFSYEDRGPYFGVFDTLGPRSQLRWIIGTADVGYAQPFGDGGEALLRIYGDGHFVDRRLQFTPDNYSTEDRNGDGRREVFRYGVQGRSLYVSNSAGAEGRVLLPLFFRHRLNLGILGEGNVIPYYEWTLNRDEKGVALRDLRKPSLSALPQNQNRAFRLGGAVYAQDEWRMLDRLYSTVGLRVNFFHDVKWDPRTHITPRAALVFEPVDDLAFKLLYGAAFRAPTFEEKYDQTSLSYRELSPGVYIGNDKLEPEYIQTAETGIDYAFSLLGFRYQVAGNVFYSFIGNSIDRIDETGDAAPIDNSGYRQIGGAESELRVEFAPGAYLYANVSWHRGWFSRPKKGTVVRPDWTQPTTYVDAITGFPGDYAQTEVSYLTVVPQFRANFGGNIELFELLSLHADVLLGSERRNNVRSTLERLRAFKIPAYSLVNLTLRTRPILGWVGFEASLYNALDYDYRDDVPRPDRVEELLPREGSTAMFGVYVQH